MADKAAWEEYDDNTLRTLVQSYAARSERRQKQMGKAVTREDLMELINEWGISFVPKLKFIEQSQGLGGARRRIIDVWAECQRGNARNVKLFIDQGEDINRLAPNNRRRTPLHCVMLATETRGSKECVDLLLDAGCDIELRDMDRLTPLFLGCQLGKRDFVEKLVVKGAEVYMDDGRWAGDKFNDDVPKETREEIKKLVAADSEKRPPKKENDDGAHDKVPSKGGCCCTVS